jgi:hypothetical protein
VLASAEPDIDFDQIEAEEPDEPTYEEIDAAVNSMYQLHGYWVDDGEGGGYKDLTRLRQGVAHVVMQHVVTSKQERKDRAISRGKLVKSVFPQLPAERDEWDHEDRPALAEQVHKWIDRKVWDLAKPDFTGQVQQMIGDLMDGMVLVRTKITADKTDAVYVTNDLGCLLEDFAGPWRQKAKRTADGFANNLAMAMERIPEQAGQFDREFKRGMKVALNSGASVLAPALTAAIDEDEDQE